MIHTVVCDLDGPILDTRTRLYTCYRGIVEGHGFVAMPMDEYWEMKRGRASVREQLARTGAETMAEAFAAEWLETIESDELLVRDIVVPGALEKIAGWRGSGVMTVLATLRQNRRGVMEQLDRLGIAAVFDVMLVTPHADSSRGKVEAVRGALPDGDASRTLWVGDSEVDIAAARELGCRVWAVATGIRSEATLAALGPDFLSPSIDHVDLSTVDVRTVGGPAGRP